MRINTQFWVIHFILQLIFSQSDYTKICSRLEVGPWREQFNTVSKKFRGLNSFATKPQRLPITARHSQWSLLPKAVLALNKQPTSLEQAVVQSSATEIIFAIKTALRERHGAAGGAVPWLLSKNERFWPNGRWAQLRGGVLSVLPIHKGLLRQSCLWFTGHRN